MSRDFWRRPQAILLAAALTFGLGAIAAGRLHSLNPPAAFKLANPNEGPSRTGFAPVVKHVLPAVVKISSSKVSKVPTEFFDQILSKL